MVCSNVSRSMKPLIQSLSLNRTTMAVNLLSNKSNKRSWPMNKDKLTLGYLGFGTGRHKPFDQVYPEGKLVTAEKIDEGIDIDGLVIWGGADISPSLYNDTVAD